MDNCNLEYHPIRENEMIDICKWNYENEYSIYNLPNIKEMKSEKIGFYNPESRRNYFAFSDDNVFIGFVNIKEEEENVFLGIGVKPQFCSKGYGYKIMDTACKIANRLYPHKQLYLEVRTWNKRAISCYEKAGFIIDGNEFVQQTLIGEGSFFRMFKPQ